MLYTVQLSVLLALQAAENNRKKGDQSKIFDTFISNFLHHEKFAYQVNWLVDNKLIDEKGNITPKGRTFSSVNPSYLSDKELGIRTNQFIFKALEKDVLPKCFQFMTEDTFLEVATLVNNEMEARYPEQMAQLVKEDIKDVIARIDESLVEEDAILNLQAPAEVIVNGEIFTEPEYVTQEVKVKKSRKKVEVQA